MKRKPMTSMVIGLAILSLAAGVAAGLLASRVVAASALMPAPADSTPLAIELQLTADQRDQMRGIWESVRTDVQRTFNDAQRLEKRRDAAMLTLLNDEQKAKFETISKEYADQFVELTARRDQTFKDAVEQTKKLLKEEQRHKYEEILRAHLATENQPAFGPSTQP